jgi:ankyrin repeat protein
VLQDTRHASCVETAGCARCWRISFSFRFLVERESFTRQSLYYCLVDSYKHQFVSFSEDQTASFGGISLTFHTMATVFDIAATGNHEQLAQLLAQNRTFAQAKSSDGSTALHIASRFGHLTCVDYLLRYGAPINERNNVGNTALHMAVGYNHTRVSTF